VTTAGRVLVECWSLLRAVGHLVSLVIVRVVSEPSW